MANREQQIQSEHQPIDRAVIAAKLRIHGIKAYMRDFETMTDENVLQVAKWLAEAGGVDPLAILPERDKMEPIDEI